MDKPRPTERCGTARRSERGGRSEEDGEADLQCGPNADAELDVATVSDELARRIMDSEQSTSTQPKSKGTKRERSEDSEEENTNSNEPLEVIFKGQQGSRRGAERGFQIERDLLMYLLLQTVKKEKRFMLGSSLLAAYPFNNVFCLYENDAIKDGKMWTLLLVKLEIAKGTRLTRASLIELNNKVPRLDCLKYAKQSIENLPNLKMLLDTCDVRNEQGTRVTSANTRIKYLIYTTAKIFSKLSDILRRDPEFDSMIRTGLGEMSEGMTLSQGFVNETAAKYFEQNEDEKRKLELLIEELPVGIGAEKYTLESKLSNLRKPENLGEIKDFLKNLMIFSDQENATQEYQRDCPMTKLLEKAVMNCFDVDISNDLHQSYAIQHAKNIINTNIKIYCKERKMITEHAAFINKVKGLIRGLKISDEKIAHWQEKYNQFDEVNDLEIADQKTKLMKTVVKTDRLKYYVNDNSMAWTTLKITGYSRQMSRCSVHDLEYVLNNTQSLINTLEIPGLFRHVFIAKQPLGDENQQKVIDVAKIIFQTIFAKNMYSEKEMIFVSKTECIAIKLMVDTLHALMC